MLVHVSQLQADQTRIGGAIERQITAWRDHERIVSGSLAMRLSSALDDLGDISQPIDRETVLREAALNLARSQVVVLNSTTGEELDYENRPERQVIAVGGKCHYARSSSRGCCDSRWRSVGCPVLAGSRWLGLW